MLGFGGVCACVAAARIHADRQQTEAEQPRSEGSKTVFYHDASKRYRSIVASSREERLRSHEPHERCQ